MAHKCPDRISHLISERGNVHIMTSHNSKIEVLSGPERRKKHLLRSLSLPKGSSR